jgi:hypothetical protein
MARRIGADELSGVKRLPRPRNETEEVCRYCGELEDKTRLEEFFAGFFLHPACKADWKQRGK